MKDDGKKKQMVGQCSSVDLTISFKINWCIH